MKVFLSWSGRSSHQIAEKLHKWLPMVIQKVEPYISTEIEKGTRWGTDIAEELEKCSFGIACVTAENKEAPWLLFEAGALSKSVSEGKLAPLLFGIDQADIQKSPLTQFQMTKFEKDEFLRLLRSINDSLEASLDQFILDSLFEALWPGLEAEINDILKKAPAPASSAGNAVDAGKVMGAIEELLTNSRAVSQVLSRPDRLLPEDYVQHVLRASGAVGSTLDRRRLSYLLARALDELMRLKSMVPDEHRKAVSDVADRIEEARFRVREGDRRSAALNEPGRPRRYAFRIEEPLAPEKVEAREDNGAAAAPEEGAG